jgi:hypothetical protein
VLFSLLDLYGTDKTDGSLSYNVLPFAQSSDWILALTLRVGKGRGNGSPGRRVREPRRGRAKLRLSRGFPRHPALRRYPHELGPSRNVASVLGYHCH